MIDLSFYMEITKAKYQGTPQLLWGFHRLKEVNFNEKPTWNNQPLKLQR